MHTLLRLYAALTLLVMAFVPTTAQQSDRNLRHATALVYKEFQPARIDLKDRRFTRVEANVFLKNGRLVYLQKGKTLEANTDNIVSIRFADSTLYLPVGRQVARVLAERDTNAILCVTTIDQVRLRAETTGGENLPYFEIEELGVFVETDGSKNASREYPIKHTFYIKHGADIFPANETAFRRHLNPELKEPFRLLMHEKYWSWQDAASLHLLLDYLR